MKLEPMFGCVFDDMFDALPYVGVSFLVRYGEVVLHAFKPTDDPFAIDVDSGGYGSM